MFRRPHSLVRSSSLRRLALGAVHGGFAVGFALAIAIPVVAESGGPPALQFDRARSAESGTEPPAQRDSAVALEEARRAQGRFERDRVRLIARDRGGFSGGACDERIGRMCVRLEGGSDWWWPEAEPTALIAAREQLIEALAEAARHAPGDGWLLGQRVIYLGEAGRWEEAGRLARRCGVTEVWWCAALEGLSLHVRGRYPEAEKVFERALGRMPADVRARWLEIEDLLGAEARDRLDEAIEVGDSSAIARFWTLSDPLFLVDGNDRYTAHLARRTWARTREGARNPYAMSWGWDLDELLIRYGWEVGWERRDPAMAAVGATASAVGHHDPRSQEYLAPPEALEGDPASMPDRWNPGSRRSPRSGYAPAYAPTFLDLDAALVRLPRGDTTVLLVQVPGLPADTTRHAQHDHPQAPDRRDVAEVGPRRGLFAVALDAGPRLYGVDLDGVEGPLVLHVPAGDYVVSVETWDPALGRAGRLRKGMSLPEVPPDVASLSDLILLDPSGPPPTELSHVAASLAWPTIFAPGDTIRVAWEVSGVGRRPERLDYSLLLRDGSGGFFSRLGRAIGVTGDPDAVGLDWSESASEGGVAHLRSTDLVIPPGFASGDFTLRLTLASVGRSVLVRDRRIEIRSDPTRR